jgi:formylglycine-generating enzyme required for sulfatase activity
MSSPNRNELRDFIVENFNRDELIAFCSDYFRDFYEDYEGTNLPKSTLVNNLIEHCEHRGSMDKLRANLQKLRPELYEKKFGRVQAVEVKTQPRNPRQVFVSHAHEDADFAQRLARDLRDAGLSVWITPDSIQPGEDWTSAIERGLDECAIFVVVLTPRSVASKWVKKETRYALEHDDFFTIRPVLALPCDVHELSRFLTQTQYADFTRGYEAGLEDLCRSLNAQSASMREKAQRAKREAEETRKREQERREREEQERKQREAETEQKRKADEERARVERERLEAEQRQRTLGQAQERASAAMKAERWAEALNAIKTWLALEPNDRRALEFKAIAEAGREKKLSGQKATTRRALLIGGSLGLVTMVAWMVSMIPRSMPPASTGLLLETPTAKSAETKATATIAPTAKSAETKATATIAPTAKSAETKATATITPTAKSAETKATATIVPSEIEISLKPGISMKFVRIPAGEFLMGSDKSRDPAAEDDELPQHNVYLSEYYIGKYEVTNAQYAVFAQAKGLSFTYDPGLESHPVVNVTWFDANDFANWLSEVTGNKIHLPTEAQWERAAGGTDGRIYPWGDVFDATKANTFEGRKGGTSPVGAYSPKGDSPDGVADMSGNVWEWCADWYDKDIYKNRRSGVKDPTGPTVGTNRVLRGASWLNYNLNARRSDRDYNLPLSRLNDYGFRVVRLPSP